MIICSWRAVLLPMWGLFSVTQPVINQYENSQKGFTQRRRCLLSSCDRPLCFLAGGRSSSCGGGCACCFSAGGCASAVASMLSLGAHSCSWFVCEYNGCSLGVPLGCTPHVRPGPVQTTCDQPIAVLGPRVHTPAQQHGSGSCPGGGAPSRRERCLCLVVRVVVG